MAGVGTFGAISADGVHQVASMRYNPETDGYVFTLDVPKPDAATVGKVTARSVALTAENAALTAKLAELQATVSAMQARVGA
jgi:hypothetical protein